MTYNKYFFHFFAALLTVFVLFLLSCKNTNQEENYGAIPTLNIERGLQNLTKRNLTDFASNIRYVQLETHENFLIGGTIRDVFVEKGKIFIHSNNFNNPFQVFDAYTGKYLYSIGDRGQGPGELSSLRDVDINVKERRIILSGGGRTLKFDFEGNFLGNITLPEPPEDFSTDILRFNVTMLDRNVFSVCAHTVSYHQFNAIYIFDEQANIINTLKSFDDLIRPHGSTGWVPSLQVGFMYRYADDIFFYRGLSDTVYVYNPSKQGFEPHFAFNFGKHRHPRRLEERNNDAIWVQDDPFIEGRGGIRENNRYIFIDFGTNRASTEPFEDYFFRDGQVVEFMNHSLYAIYDKQERVFQFLLQPIRGIRGLVNDIDNGIPFFPKSVSSTGELVDFHQAFRFIEHAEKLPNPDESFLRILKSIDEEDNPIVIIATPL